MLNNPPLRETNRTRAEALRGSNSTKKRRPLQPSPPSNKRRKTQVTFADKNPQKKVSKAPFPKAPGVLTAMGASVDTTTQFHAIAHGIVANSMAVTDIVSAIQGINRNLYVLTNRVSDLEARQRNAMASIDAHFIFPVHNQSGRVPSVFPATLGGLHALSSWEVEALLKFYSLGVECGSFGQKLGLLCRFLCLVNSRYY